LAADGLILVVESKVTSLVREIPRVTLYQDKRRNAWQLEVLAQSEQHSTT
jgi:hypothetical protein